MTSGMLSFFPEPAPGEHIFSVLARYQYASLVSKDFVATMNKLFGGYKRLNLKSIWRPEYDILWSFYGGVLDRKRLLVDHTSFYYDAKFLGLNQCESIIAGKHYGLSSFNGTKNIPNIQSWRWCDKCVEEDMDIGGIRYWHVVHQIPSMFTCLRHNQPLSYMCEHCGFVLFKLSKHQLPPKDSRCYNCHHVMSAPNYSLNEEQIWLENFSKQILNSPLYGGRTTIPSLLRQALNAPDTEKQLTKNDRKLISRAQLHLNDWVDNKAYKSYFSLINMHGIRIPNPYSLNLIHLMYRDGLYHPLCFLAALTAFCSKQSIENLLL